MGMVDLPDPLSSSEEASLRITRICKFQGACIPKSLAIEASINTGDEPLGLHV